MKYILAFLLTLSCVYTLSAQETFSLKFELVKPTGKVDSTSYFLVTLTNRTDSIFMITDGYKAETICEHTFFMNEILMKDGQKSTGEKYQSFDFGKKKMMHIPPKGSVSRKLPIFRKFFDGILPDNNTVLLQMNQVRIILGKFQYFNMTEPSKEIKTIELYSNYLNINGSDFISYANELKVKR